MKILISNPPWEVKDRKTVRSGSRWPHSYVVHPEAKKTYMPFPFFLSYASSYLREKLPKSEIIFRDSLVRMESKSSFLSYLSEEIFDYIVLEVSTPSLEFDKSVIRDIRKNFQQTKIILVGQNIAYDGQNLMDSESVFAAIKGECEKPLYECIKNNRGGLYEFSLLSQEEMNHSPKPLREEFMYDYFDVKYFHGENPVLQMWTSRGCPYKCSFCTWPQSMTLNKVRFYKPEYLESEIRDVLDRFPHFSAIYFDDDTFNMNDRHVLNVCSVMKKINLPWSAMCRADTIKESTWEEMAKSGCVGVKVGVESGSQRILDEVIHKQLNLDDVRHFVPFIRNLGIKVHGTFMYGNPTETQEEMLLTKKFIEEVGFDHIQESGAAPLAGTKLWNLNQHTHTLKETDGKKYIESIEKELAESELGDSCHK